MAPARGKRKAAPPAPPPPRRQRGATGGSGVLVWKFTGAEGDDPPLEQRAVIGETVFDAADGGGRAVLLGSEYHAANGSMLMLKIKYLSGDRKGGELTRSSKYIKVME
jgi:hypothetical protein